jgi:Rrf2 family protein
MTKLHRKVEYALIALKHISQASAGRVVSAAEIAQHYNAPAELMARVLQLLTRAGFLRSVAGASGGYQLARSVHEITLLDLLNTLEGPLEIARCLNSTDESDCEIHSTCNIISPVQQLNLRLNAFYRTVKLGELLNLNSVSEVVHV